MTRGDSGGLHHVLRRYNVEDVGTNVPRMGRLSDTSIDHAQSHTVGTIVFEDRSATDRFNILLDAFVPRGSVFDIGGTLLTVDVDCRGFDGRAVFLDHHHQPWLDQGPESHRERQPAPVVTEAAVNGDQLTLTFAEDARRHLNTRRERLHPLHRRRHHRREPLQRRQHLRQRTVTMTLAAAVTNGQTVTMDYAPPSTNPLRDESEFDAPGFTARTVTTTPPPPPTTPPRASPASRARPSAARPSPRPSARSRTTTA